MEQRVKDDGESESQPVMGWIGVKLCPTRKRADFHQVSRHEKIVQTVQSGKADGGNGTLCGCIVSWCAHSCFRSRRRLYVCIVKHACNYAGLFVKERL